MGDFGLALLLDASGDRRTRTGVAMGTPGYMAPEQIRNAKGADRRADVFALGCILYELWCGAPPFRGESVYDVLTAIEDRDFPAPKTLRPDLPDLVDRAIDGCLQPDPDRRTASVDSLKDLLYGKKTAPGAAPEPAPASKPTPDPTPATPPQAAHPAIDRSASPDPGVASTVGSRWRCSGCCSSRAW